MDLSSSQREFIDLSLYFLVPTVISFACSLLEGVLLSISPAHIAIGVKQGSRSMRLMKRMKSHIDRPLAAILMVNTIAQTAGAAGMGAHVLRLFGEESVAIASAIMTFLILVVAELIPKKLAVLHWRMVARPAAYAMYALVTVTYPLVVIVERLSNLVTKMRVTAGITREEVLETVEMGASEGNLKQKETGIIRNLLGLQNVSVTDIMTPRTSILGAEAEQNIGQLMQKQRQLRFSRLPLFEGTLDRIVGFVHRHAILDAYSRDKDQMPLRQLMRPVSRVSHRFSVGQVLDEFMQRREHIFIVEDDRRRTIGLVTIDDALEVLLGGEIGERNEAVIPIDRAAIGNWTKLRVRPLSLADFVGHTTNGPKPGPPL